MAIDYSTAVLIPAVKRRAGLPDAQPRFSDDNIAAFLDEEMRNILTPLIMSTVEEHFVSSVDYSVTPTSFTFDIPPQAIGHKLTDVNRLIEGSTEEYGLVQLYPNVLTQGRRVYEGYIVRGNKIVIQPAPTSSYTIRVYFYRRPNQLVAPSKGARITVIAAGAGLITCALVPSNWATSGERIDAVDNKPTFEVLFENVAAGATTTGTVTVTTAQALLLTVGGYLTRVGESVVPTQIPYEGHSLMIEAAVGRIAEALGDAALLKSSRESYEQLKRSFLLAIAPRVDRAQKKVAFRGGNCWDW